VAAFCGSCGCLSLSSRSVLNTLCLSTACLRPLPLPCPQEYYITFPTYYAHNLLLGTLRMDIGDKTHIICTKSGLRADIEFTQVCPIQYSIQYTTGQHIHSTALSFPWAASRMYAVGP
jgi:hypothetical protein